MPSVLYYPDKGWLFVGRDNGSLYCAELVPDSWTLFCGDYPDANGWEVNEVKLEWWGREFPTDPSDLY